uniref:DUF6077 domain-containing protein n=1 Tax=Agathobacter sp. TaxID=2021311 RepID=UPI004057B164
MLQFLLQSCFAVLFLLAVPYCVGNGISGYLKIRKTISKNYFLGMITIWALLQIIAVPLILLKQSFLLLVAIITILLLLLCAYGLKIARFPTRLHLASKMECFAVAMLFLAAVMLLLCTVFLQHTDADDSRFVVNAVDIVRTNRMFLTNPINGEEAITWTGEIVKDVTAPWALFIAYFSKMTGIFPTIMAHTILPVILLVCAFCVFWMLSDVFFKNDILHRCIFVCLIILLNLYGHFSIYSAETFLLTRIWQGKAAVAGIGVPAMFLIAMWIYEEGKKTSYYIVLLFANLAMCLMSGMGVIIGAMMLGCIGFVYGIIKKNIRVSLRFWCLCIPNVIYYLLHMII